MIRIIKALARSFVELVVLLVATSGLSSAADEARGSIKGTVIDVQSKQPLSGVIVIVKDTRLGAYCDAQGNFAIKDIAVGTYSLTFRLVGYAPQARTDVIVRPGRITFLNVALREASIQTEEVEVDAGAFSRLGGPTISTSTFNSEEVRRAPGSGGDVSRVLDVLPSVAQVDSRENGLAVRGGSPMENAFFIDHIQVPNINHFPNLGNSAGAISLLNIDFVDDVSLQAGGFGASYGNRLSSVVNVAFREGNRDEFDGQIDFNASGFGGGIEGPLPGFNGSFMISGRRSYLDLLVEGLGTGVAPRFGNVQGKVVLDLDNDNRLTFLDLWGRDDFTRDKNDAIDDEEEFYGQVVNTQHTAGLTWRNLWGEGGFSMTSLSYSSLDRTDEWDEVDTDLREIQRHTDEGSFKLRNTNFYQAFDSHSFEFGVDAAVSNVDFDYYFAQDTSATTGAVIPEFTLKRDLSTSRFGGFLSWMWKIVPTLELSTSVRADYFEWNEESTLAPRISMAWQLSPLLTIKSAGGLYFQNLPLALLAQSPDRETLATPQAIHYLLGMEYMLEVDTKVSVEGYYKTYDDFPLDPQDPFHFPVDNITLESDIGNSSKLVSGGQARSYGVELLLQKKLQKDLYGLISASFFRSEYKDLTGIWRSRSYDNQYLLSVIGGYKPDKLWEFSARFTVAGGRPYTPFDVNASRNAGFGVLNANRIMDERFPVYHALNLRVDRRFNFASSGLIVYLDVWNAYNQENIAYYEWDRKKGVVEAEQQWSVLPVLGVEFEF